MSSSTSDDLKKFKNEKQNDYYYAIQNRRNILDNIKCRRLQRKKGEILFQSLTSHLLMFVCFSENL